MTWVTWIARGLDHLACPWRITRVLNRAPVVPVVSIWAACSAHLASDLGHTPIAPARRAVQP
jgi:hypothetical protein